VSPRPGAPRVLTPDTQLSPVANSHLFSISPLIIGLSPLLGQWVRSPPAILRRCFGFHGPARAGCGNVCKFQSGVFFGRAHAAI